MAQVGAVTDVGVVYPRQYELVRAMKVRGVTLDQVAQAAGIKPSTLQWALRTGFGMAKRTAELIAYYLHRQPADLFSYYRAPTHIQVLPHDADGMFLWAVANQMGLADYTIWQRAKVVSSKIPKDLTRSVLAEYLRNVVPDDLWLDRNLLGWILDPDEYRSVERKLNNRVRWWVQSGKVSSKPSGTTAWAAASLLTARFVPDTLDSVVTQMLTEGEWSLLSGAGEPVSVTSS